MWFPLSEACGSPAGTVPDERHGGCRPCEAGFFPLDGQCAACERCPAGHVADAARARCLPCPAAQYVPEDSDSPSCLPCPANHVSEGGAAACAPCGAGSERDVAGVRCLECPPGSFRNASLPSCTPCFCGLLWAPAPGSPQGTYAAGRGAAACAVCAAGRQLCPVATGEPIDLPAFDSLLARLQAEAGGTGSGEAGARAVSRRALRGLEPASVSEEPAAGAEAVASDPASGSRRRALLRFRALLDSASASEQQQRTERDAVVLGTTTAALSQPIPSSLFRIARAQAIEAGPRGVADAYRAFALAAGAGAAALLSLAAALSAFLASAPDPAARAARAARVARLDLFFREEAPPAAAPPRRAPCACHGAATTNAPAPDTAADADVDEIKKKGEELELEEGRLGTVGEALASRLLYERGRPLLPLPAPAPAPPARPPFRPRRPRRPARAPAPAARAPAPRPPASTSTSRHVFVRVVRPASACRLQPVEKEEEGEEGAVRAPRTVAGAVFSVLALVLAAVAAAFVAAQFFALANEAVVASLAAGASPSAGAIAGEFAAEATFYGYAGPCRIERVDLDAQQAAAELENATGTGLEDLSSGVAAVEAAGAYVSVAHVTAELGAGASAAAEYSAANRTCRVSWRCGRCRVAAGAGASVELRLAARLALAHALSFRLVVRPARPPAPPAPPARPPDPPARPPCRPARPPPRPARSRPPAPPRPAPPRPPAPPARPARPAPPARPAARPARPPAARPPRPAPPRPPPATPRPAPAPPCNWLFILNLRRQVPGGAVVEGAVVPRGRGRAAVLRGARPVEAPLLLTPAHFPDPRDGSPGYRVSLRPAPNHLSEADEASFGLCAAGRPLSDAACAGERVAFRASFAVSPLHLRVARVRRAAPLEALADAAAFAGAAFALVAHLIAARSLLAALRGHRRPAFLWGLLGAARRRGSATPALGSHASNSAKPRGGGGAAGVPVYSLGFEPEEEVEFETEGPPPRFGFESERTRAVPHPFPDAHGRRGDPLDLAIALGAGALGLGGPRPEGRGAGELPRPRARRVSLVSGGAAPASGSPRGRRHSHCARDSPRLATGIGAARPSSRIKARDPLDIDIDAAPVPSAVVQRPRSRSLAPSWRSVGAAAVTGSAPPPGEAKAVPISLEGLTIEVGTGTGAAALSFPRLASLARGSPRLPPSAPRTPADGLAMVPASRGRAGAGARTPSASAAAPGRRASEPGSLSPRPPAAPPLAVQTPAPAAGRYSFAFGDARSGSAFADYRHVHARRGSS
eukprot:tig00021680_g23028.t1